MIYYCRCVEAVKTSQYVELANDLEINKAITYLRQKNFTQVYNSSQFRFCVNALLV